MTRQGINSVPMLITVDRTQPGSTLHRQVYQALRSAILEGRLCVGARLPGTRVLADDLGVSRTTIVTAYEQLKAEGHLRGKRGGGTLVALSLTSSGGSVAIAGEPANKRSTAAQLSELGSRMVAACGEVRPLRQNVRPQMFSLGVPALDAFPVATWARLTARRWRKTPRLMLSPDDGAGYGPLRQAIADHIIAARGVRCSAEQIVITAGAQQAIDLIARLLLNPGDTVCVEAHGYAPARAAFAGVGARLVEVESDEEGFSTEQLLHVAPDAKLVFVTPACEPPSAVTMSLNRRCALLHWVHETGSWIVEDDYNGELLYGGRPMAALRGMQHPGAQQVVYLRTFTKTLFPALRLGYVVLPDPLVDAFMRARLIADRHSPTAEQAVLADFIAEGHFARHVRGMRELYADRQRAFLDLAARELADLLRFRPATAGLRLMGCLPPGVSDRRVAEEAGRRGVIVEPVSRAGVPSLRQQGLVFGYVPFSAAETRRGFGKLAEAIQAVLREPSRPR
jgi:GntR family transcriptional regulator / MocR family aminotransferase